MAKPVGDKELDTLPEVQLEAGNAPLFSFESNVILDGRVSVKVVSVAGPLPVLVTVSAY